jgi:hypothetical protein
MNLRPGDEHCIIQYPIFVVVFHSHASQKSGGVGSTATVHVGTALKDSDETEAVDFARGFILAWQRFALGTERTPRAELGTTTHRFQPENTDQIVKGIKSMNS